MAKKKRRGNLFWDGFRPGARISARTFDALTGKGGKKRGQPRLVFLRPPEDDDPDLPDPDDDPPPDDPCAGRPFVHPPLVAAQLDLAFAGEPRPCPSPAEVELIKAAVRSQFGTIIPKADVRVACRHPILTIAVFEPAGGGPCDELARQRALDALDLLEVNEGFGFMLRGTLITSQAERSFDLAPKRLSGNGAPSSIGPIHLTSLAVEFRPPDTVVTRIEGYDDRPWPDVGFSVLITDRFRRDATAIPSTPVINASDRDIALAVLSLIVLGLTGALLTPFLLPAALWVLAGDLEAAIAAGDPSGVAGVGRRALGLVPREIPLPGGTKLEVGYGRTDVTPGGLFFGGRALPVARQPAAALVGPRALVISDQARDVSAVFRLATADTFGALTIAWSAGSRTTVARPNGRETTITFSRASLTDDQPFTRTVRVTVADQDGFATELSQEVEVFVADDDGLPPICAKHPTLPQCLPPGGGFDV